MTTTSATACGTCGKTFTPITICRIPGTPVVSSGPPKGWRFNEQKNVLQCPECRAKERNQP